MYARTSIITAAPSSLDDGIAYVRNEVWPAVQGMGGCVGMSMVVDPETGRTITTTSWDSEESLSSSRARVMPLRDRAVALMEAGPPVIEEWEVLSMHRMHATHPGTCVRAAWSRVFPGNVAPAVEFYRQTLLPEIEQLDGFVSASLLVDRLAGRGVLSVAFDTREAMERTRDHADYLRARSTQEANVETLDVGEFDLAMAHLHIPELV